MFLTVTLNSNFTEYCIFYINVKFQCKQCLFVFFLNCDLCVKFMTVYIVGGIIHPIGHSEI